ncbi:MULTISPECIES: non-heme iron oxygenase ferredoxin subunit [Pusillimonas]|uniref:3-phenylpropionate/trans-cinnamate dioxygenase ferredoxin subunit n=1 Tax=Pusillimonas noertemannii TaxID=305977 RepID=A0A2U1CGX4_9BURK|nr:MULTISPECIES: non-heme iron oxygenase ferredoxin subunit [Pusillimonas]MDX3896200.1 non-heme iron oxygenase ferredoxin subunit [Pusillimonas sp.]NYT70418.1 non-heme iron oxygenase ferredoxin subunit [Pusillimonas noertemannii]PVY60158.1 3-phenylpropionate/trans-cinnamate dioxygenase ferredoxin subunit [Pusillimonas noertemannii]TFL08628.1 non-heme iron oxygenase ferredoxin subunit [Pusillimonas noertemannii]
MANWIKIAQVGQVDEDESLAIEVDGKQLALHHTEGEYFVTDNVCTHQYALLSDGYIEDGCVECPLHQAQFDLRTGKAMCAPATVDIQTYQVKTEGEDILVEL